MQVNVHKTKDTQVCHFKEAPLAPVKDSPYLPNAQRVKLAFEIVDSFILTEAPQIEFVLNTLAFLAMTKLLPTLRHSDLDINALSQISASLDYQELRKRAIKFRVYTRLPFVEDMTIDKLLYISDCSVAASDFIRSKSSFSVLRSVIIKHGTSADRTLSFGDFTIMKEDLTYVLQSASEGDFEVVSECLRFQRSIRSYWASIFGASL